MNDLSAIFRYETEKANKKAGAIERTEGFVASNYENGSSNQNLEPATWKIIMWSPIIIALIAGLPGIITAISSFRNGANLKSVKSEQSRVAFELGKANGLLQSSRPTEERNDWPNDKTKGKRPRREADWIPPSK